MCQIQLKDVTKNFGKSSIIKGIDLSIKDRELIVFVGPSGCGKSTLLRLISGLEGVSSGKIFIDNEDVTHLPPSKRGIAMVFQSYALYPHMTVFENMSFGLKLAKEEKLTVVKKVEAAAEILQISHLLQQLPKQLSGGQRQRVAIGRAIVRNPKVFLFDEPLSNLDAALRGKTRIELAKLHKSLPSTMIYVTHDQVEAMTLADRIVVLNAGRIEQIGSPMELFNSPRNIFVAGFIGSPRMNFLKTWVDQVLENGILVRFAGTAKSFHFAVMASSHKNDTVTIGIRPEHLEIKNINENPTGPSIDGKIILIEKMGSESFVHVNVSESDTLTIKVNGDIFYKDGELVKITWQPEFCHVFNSDGLALEKASAYKNSPTTQAFSL